jgi:hypothetical protein
VRAREEKRDPMCAAVCAIVRPRRRVQAPEAGDGRLGREEAGAPSAGVLSYSLRDSTRAAPNKRALSHNPQLSLIKHMCVHSIAAAYDVVSHFTPLGVCAVYL